MAIDPGGTTGWAKGWIPTASLLDPTESIWEGGEVEYGEIGGSENYQTEELDYLLSRFVGPVIIEDFTLRQFRQDNALLAPVRMTAKIEYSIYLINSARAAGGRYTEGNPDFAKRYADLALGNSHKRLTVIKQQPALAKQTATDERLKEWGLWVNGMPHARDANRHLATFLRRAKNDRRLIAEAWPWAAAW